jgi:hypothetical protein
LFDKKKYTLEYYQKNRDKIVERMTEYYKKNRSIILQKRKEYQKEYHQRSKTKQLEREYRQNPKWKRYRREYEKKWYQRNEKRRTRSQTLKMKRYQKEFRRKYYLKNKDKLLQQQKDWLQIPINNQHRIEYDKKYYQKNIERITEYRNSPKNKLHKKEWQKKYRKKNPRSNSGGRESLEELQMMNLRRIEDNNTCQYPDCMIKHSRKTPIHVHHFLYPRRKYRNRTSKLDELICFCPKHHALWHEEHGDKRSAIRLRGRQELF